MGEVFQELKRRNIFRVAVAYVMLSWVLLQAVGLIAPGIGLPDWTFPLVFLFLIIGFPVALIFAWAFELTTEGLKRTTEVHPENSLTSNTGRKLDFIIIGFLSVALLFFVVDRLFVPSVTRPPTTPDETAVDTAGSWSSIAVMPFVNMSSDADQEYFSDGISEELLNVLGKAKGLRVAARTSSFSFKDKDTTIPKIGSLLNVETVLEGSVRKSGTKLRITAQLIEVATGYHIWSETYNRETRDIFQIQDEIANSIVSAMSTHLPGLEETTEPKHQPTLEAYNYYLAGRQLLEQRQSISKSITLFDQAIAADPLFASAYASKAEAVILSIPGSAVPNTEEEVQILSLADTALKLDPDLAEAYAARGLLHYAFANFDKAIVELERAISLNPNLAEAHMWLALNYTRSGRQKDALSQYALAYERDPLHRTILTNYAIKLSKFGRYEEAMAIIDRKDLIDISEQQRARTLAVRIEFALVQGNIAEAYRAFVKLGDLAPEGYGISARFSPFDYLSLKERGDTFDAMPKETMILLYVVLGRTGEARSVLQTVSGQERKERPGLYAKNLGSVLALEGHFVAAVEAFEQVPYSMLADISDVSPNVGYGWSLSQIGRQVEADQLLDDIMNQVVDQRKSQRVYWRTRALPEAEVHVLRGELEKAIDVLEEAYDLGMRMKVWRDYPLFALIKDHPRFVALFDKIDEDFRLARIEVGLAQPSESK